MIEKWLELLGGFIVEAFCRKVGVENRADLEALLGAIVKRELPDLSKFDTLPDQIIANVTASVTTAIAPLLAIPTQVVAQIKAWLPPIPGLPNIFGR